MENKALHFVNIRLVKDRTWGEGNVITEYEDAVRFIVENVEDFDREHFISLNLDIKGRVINANIISIGDLTACLVHPREVFKSSILSNASSVIFLHNHPSGDPSPSKEDIEITKRLTKAGYLLGIKVLDHIIIGANKQISLMEEREELFCRDEDIYNKELEAWEKEYSLSKEKITESYTNVKIERVIEGIPHSFSLTAEELKEIYSKVEKEKGLLWDVGEPGKEISENPFKMPDIQR